MAAIVLSLMLPASMLVPELVRAESISVTIDGQVMRLADVPSDAWYATYVRDAVSSNIVSGYRDASGVPLGRFGPADPVTLAQTLKIVVLGAGYDPSKFGPVPAALSGSWVSPYLVVSAAQNFTVFQTRENLDRPATRSEVASLFADAFRVDIPTAVSARYSDVDESTPFATSIEALSRDGILSGDTDSTGRPINRFRPLDPINRAEVTKMIMIARGTYGTPGTQFPLSGSSSSLSSTSDSSSSSSVSSSSGSSVSSASSSIAAAMVTYTGSGFIPPILSVDSGTTVRFYNASNAAFWPASDPHPAHTDYPGFDALRSYGTGESYYFTFLRTGTWGYHNHLNPTQTGSIVVR
jgi:plastocyanin